MKNNQKETRFWRFIDEDATFIATNIKNIPYLYFPLANESSFMSSITPDLKGDIKTSNNSFLLKPVSRVDLIDTQSSRNFWVYSNSSKKAWSLAFQRELTYLKAGLLFHIIEKTNRKIGIKAKVLNFVPATNEKVEIMLITITNITGGVLKLTCTSAIPIYGRSADNIRDHRHVTTLLNRIQQHKYGVILKPTMCFDEKGHRVNNTLYYILGVDGNNCQPEGSFPTYEVFLGPTNNFQKPSAIFSNLKPILLNHQQLSGKEAMGAIRFKQITLKANQSFHFIILLGIAESRAEIFRTFNKFRDLPKVKAALKENQRYWLKKANSISFYSGNKLFDNWLKWVNTQPSLRKIFGCSFLPDFDYGRGGKGWRDLWQDCLALSLVNPSSLRKVIISNFSGVRINGTNATIITNKPGEFISDRNRIQRVWMDHGIWPYFTLELYIHLTGDINILFEKTKYFNDGQFRPNQQINYNHLNYPKVYSQQKNTYQGTLLEHILIQHLVSFFNVGKHNNMRLENADWNDGLDMAPKGGESVAFSCFYAYNLSNLAKLLTNVKQIKKIKKIKLLKELSILLDTIKRPIDYNQVKQKQLLLKKYLSFTQLNFSGKTVDVNIDSLIEDLRRKSNWIIQHIRKKEWININKKYGFFNGYYDNNAKRLEGKIKNKIRMTLTGQVFPILADIATEDQIKKILNSVANFLKDKENGGIRLNTDFKEPQMNMGRAFSFSYGDKENGAVFSHMCVMYAYALYKRGFAHQGYEVLNSLFSMAVNTSKSKIYPNLPEYFNLQGQGMYSYLTGSASWYILTLFTEVYGVRGYLGDLVIYPKLTKELFKNSESIEVRFNFAGKNIILKYHNNKKIDFPNYCIQFMNPKIPYEKISPQKILIRRKTLASFSAESISLNIILE